MITLGWGIGKEHLPLEQKNNKIWYLCFVGMQASYERYFKIWQTPANHQYGIWDREKRRFLAFLLPKISEKVKDVTNGK